MTWMSGRSTSRRRTSLISLAAAARTEPFRFISSTPMGTTSSCARRCQRQAKLLRQRRADDFLVIPGKDAFVRESGMAPDDQSPETVAGRLQQMGAADFFVGFRAEAGDDQVTGFAEDEVALTV